MSLLVLFFDLWVATGPIQFEIPGQQWKLDHKLEKKWWAVCGERLVKATVHRAPHEDPDQEIVVVDQCPSSQLIVRGIPGMKPRSVLPARIDDGQHFHWAGRDFELLIEKRQLRLADGANGQVLAEHVESAEVRWAGDLDDDGELDLVLDTGLGGDLILFLSTGKRPGTLVREAARKPLSGC